MPSNPSSHTAAHTLDVDRLRVNVLDATRERISSLLKRSCASRADACAILVVEDEKIESERQSSVVIAPVVQQVELRDSLFVEADSFGVDDRMTFDPRRFLDNAGITFRPVSPVHRVEAYPALLDVHL